MFFLHLKVKRKLVIVINTLIIAIILYLFYRFPEKSYYNQEELKHKYYENLVGPIYANLSILNYLDVETELLERQKLNIYNGGFSYQSNFIWQQKIAIIIPFRNRDTQLNTFLNHMHPFLIKQKLNYRIFVVEQVENSTFNRAMLLNIGFVESLQYDFFNCFIFHDIDLLPENDHNIYGCENAPSHFSVAIDTMNYTLPYPSIFGGIEVFKKSQFMAINGFSNLFWGWGGEDDDLYDRYY
uniref:Beta-1,4-N-acetylgalactosaminyltransferase bre-4 (Trinotate prediction) n=1 Tax=Myxobolus squamalis TaxID=59785 RepID=A0A6B2FY48_MYXSQ